jgi:hypothetical protein
MIELRPGAPQEETYRHLHECFEDSPVHFKQLAVLLSRGARPQFGYLTVKFERGKIVLIEEHVTHK